MRDLIAARKQDAKAALAVDLFCYRAKKYIGAYLTALGGADAILFGGGIGEHILEVRAQICDGIEWLGLKLDSAVNKEMVGKEGRITANSSKIEAYVISVDESAVIAEEAVRLLVN
jgi:acetate kinase